MPKASKEFGYSNRHIRRLRNQQTKLEIKKLAYHNVNGKSNDDHEELNVNYNKNFEKSEENIYDGDISNDDNFSIDDDDDDQMNFSPDSDSVTEFFNFDETNNFKEESMHTNYLDINTIDSDEDSEYSTDCDMKKKEFDFNLSDSDSDRNNNTSPSSSESEEDEGEEEKS
ncbi:clumping factor B-like [Leptopilina heterotoma]|uniref:clumping factor B-like n=1 Tax=Leptopilina heterotoma TaxID=63436 RepID=UPI001CA91EA2|nr:clumping factor B-like [Leptopilina heterotoma]